VGYPDASHALRPAAARGSGRGSAPAWPHASPARDPWPGSAARLHSTTPAGTRVSTLARSTPVPGRRTSRSRPAYDSERTDKTGSPPAWQPLAAMGLDGIAITRDTVAGRGATPRSENARGVLPRRLPGRSPFRQHPASTASSMVCHPRPPSPAPHPGGDDGAHQRRSSTLFTRILRFLAADDTRMPHLADCLKNAPIASQRLGATRRPADVSMDRPPIDRFSRRVDPGDTSTWPGRGKEELPSPRNDTGDGRA